MNPDPNNNQIGQIGVQPDPGFSMPFPPPPTTDFTGTPINNDIPPSIPLVDSNSLPNSSVAQVDSIPLADNPYLNGQMGSYDIGQQNNTGQIGVQPDPGFSMPPPPPVDSQSIIDNSATIPNNNWSADSIQPPLNNDYNFSPPPPSNIPVLTDSVDAKNNFENNIPLNQPSGSSFNEPVDPTTSPLIDDNYLSNPAESYSNPYINPEVNLNNDNNPDKAEILQASDILEVPVGSPSDSFVGSSVLQTPSNVANDDGNIPDLVNNISNDGMMLPNDNLGYEDYDSSTDLSQDAKKEKLIKMIIIGLAGLFALILILVLIFSFTNKGQETTNTQNTNTNTGDNTQNTNTTDTQDIRKDIPSDAPLKDFKWFSTNCFSFQIPEPTTLSGEGGDEKNCIIPQNTFGSFKLTTFSVSYIGDTITDTDTAIEDWKGKNAGIRVISQDDTELDGEPAVQILYEKPAGANSETSRSSVVFVMKKYKYKGITYNGFIIECLTYNDWSVGKFKDILKTWYWR